jgi:MFS family permease
MTTLCGFAQSYSQLFAARIGVGIGEAALAPAAYSMICDLFRPQRRGAALGVYSSGIYLGIGVSIALGGVVLAFISGAAKVALPLIGEVRSWQAAFICVGAPGLAVALLMLTVKEPARHDDGAPGINGRSVMDAWRYLKGQRSLFFRQILGYTCMAAAAYGAGSWVPTYLMRIHHMSPSRAGIAYGVAVSLLGTVGGVAGGLLGDRWLAVHRSDARILISVIASIFWIPCLLVGTQAGTPMTAVVMMGAASCFSSACNGLGPTTVQDVVPGWLRGQATALYFFVINLVGLGIGPTAVALATEHLFGYDAAVRFSIPLVVIPLIILGALLLLGVRTQYREAREALL